MLLYRSAARLDVRRHLWSQMVGRQAPNRAADLYSNILHLILTLLPNKRSINNKWHINNSSSSSSSNNNNNNSLDNSKQSSNNRLDNSKQRSSNNYRCNVNNNNSSNSFIFNSNNNNNYMRNSSSK